MHHTAELLLAPDYPEPEGWLSDLVSGPSIQLWWPVASLPPEMGWLETAERLPDDNSCAYYLLAWVACFSDSEALFGVHEASDGSIPEIHIDYETLAHLIAEADTRVRRQGEHPMLSVYRLHRLSGRRFRAYLRVRPDAPANDTGAAIEE